MIELGGKIFLEEFSSLEPAKLIVVKKIVGSYVRNVEFADKTFLKLILKLSQSGNEYCIEGALENAVGKKEAEARDINLFYSLNSVLTKLRN
ncbi:MAG TPA: hypothetical protein VJB89_03355 [Candidatus Nanoarchaeia archaeon]|nr:hypothetical protein [Candidatus Nanoarchaeia archaeon]